MNTPRYEETAALAAEKKARIEPLIAELCTLPPFPGDAIALTGCKPTIGDMRRNATRLRAGKLRPRDPDANPIDVAGRLEKGARWLEVLEALAVEFLDTAARLQVMIDAAEAEAYDACVTTFLDAKQLAKEPGSTLGPWVEAMEHALRREKGRG
jgi:hypothetical protein